MRALHRFLSLAVAGLGVALPSCGRGDTAPTGDARHERPQLTLVEGAAPPLAERSRRMQVPEGLEPWTASGRSCQVSERDGEPILAFGPQDEDASLAVPGDFDMRDIQRVVLRGRFPATFRMTIRMSGAGQKPTRPPTLIAVEGEDEQALAFDLDRTFGTAIRYELLEIYAQGPPVAFELTAIELVSVPLDRFLPAPGEDPAPVEVAGTSRWSIGLAPGRPAECRFRVESARERLSFAVALPPRLRPRGGDGALRVELSAPGVATVERDLELASGRGHERWHEQTLELGAFVGHETTARFEYASAAPTPGVCALTGVELWSPQAKPPTVILVSSDTHRADHIGAAESGVEVDTPSIDALARGGVFFEHCWSTTNITSPSHVAMLTGLHPRDTRIVTNLDRLSTDAHTLAEAFQAAGWATHAVVSVRHLGPRGTDLSQGFDKLLSPTSEPWDAEQPVARALEWLEASGERPVFLFLHLFDAHHPYAPPASHDRRYYPPDRDPADPSLPPLDFRAGSMPADLVAAGVRDLEFPRAQYRAEVSYLDEALGAILAHPRARAGLVAVTADHGEILEKDGTYFNHGELFPDTLHVPLVLGGARVPEELRGARIEARVSQLDLARTLLDLGGLPRAEFPGRNLLLAHEFEEGAEEPAHFALSAHAFSASITWNGWYLMLHLKTHQGTLARQRLRHETELYDLANDPECLVDVAAEHPEREAALRARLVEWLLAAAPGGLSQRRQATLSELQELAALGYAEEAPVVEEEAWYDPDAK